MTNETNDLASMSSTVATRAAEELLDSVDGDLSDEDALRFQELVTRAREAQQAERAAAGHDLVRRFRSGELTVDGSAPVSPGTDDRRLSFGPAMAAQAVERMAARDGDATRAVAAGGSTVVEQGFEPDPYFLGRPMPNLLAALPTKQHPTHQFSYLRQTVRTNLAAVVAEGNVKPTSVLTVERVEDSLDVVAHLSEGVPRHWFMDNPTLQAFIGKELTFGLRQAVEALVLDTINAPALNIADQPFIDSSVVTLRKSLTQLEISGHEASVFVLHPSDWESIELLISSVDAIETLSLPFDPATRRLWGVPIAVTIGQSEGLAHTIAKGPVAVDTDSRGVDISWTETSNDDDWSKNLIRCRVEGRFAASVYQPLGVVVSDLGVGSALGS